MASAETKSNTLPGEVPFPLLNDRFLHATILEDDLNRPRSVNTTFFIQVQPRTHEYHKFAFCCDGGVATPYHLHGIKAKRIDENLYIEGSLSQWTDEKLQVCVTFIHHQLKDKFTAPYKRFNISQANGSVWTFKPISEDSWQAYSSTRLNISQLQTKVVYIQRSDGNVWKLIREDMSATFRLLYHGDVVPGDYNPITALMEPKAETTYIKQ